MAYIDCDYKGSIAYNTVMGTSKQGLRNSLPYYENAVIFHTEQGNEGQVKFFQDGVILINKRLKLKSVRE